MLLKNLAIYINFAKILTNPMNTNIITYMHKKIYKNDYTD